MTSHELTPEAQAAIRKIEKLLALAGNNPNEAEAAAAMAKVQELLAQYNLDMASVGDAPADKSRGDVRLKGGLYKWQRSLWKAVAELNFCMYWSTYEIDMTKKAVYVDRYGDRRMGRKTFKHKVLGRKVNVVSTQIMAEYLEQAIERLVRDRLEQDHTQFFTRWAASYREGVADRLQSKLYKRRQELQAEEERRERERAAQSRHPAAAPTSSGVDLATYTQSEYDANIDHLYGEGTSARWAAERYQAEQAAKKAREERAAWELAHPAEAAAQKAQAEKEWQEWLKKNAGRNRRSSGGYRERKSNRDDAGYYAGYEDGASIGLDPQVNKSNQRRLA